MEKRHILSLFSMIIHIHPNGKLSPKPGNVFNRHKNQFSQKTKQNKTKLKVVKKQNKTKQNKKTKQN